MTTSNCFCSTTFENPHGFSIRFLFAKLRAKPRNKHVIQTRCVPLVKIRFMTK